MSEEKSVAEIIDASTGQATAMTVPTERETKEVLEMVMGEENYEVLGRMGNGFDVSDFDLLPTDRIFDTANQSEGPAGDELDLLAGDYAPALFQAQTSEQFPVFTQALREFQAAEERPKIVRVDTDASYGDFVTQKVADEIVRRLDALEAAVHAHEHNDHAHHLDRMYKALEEHTADPYAHMNRHGRAAKSEEVMGAVQAVADLHNAESHDEAMSAIPSIPLDIPAYAEGKVKCWRDGENLICSIRFASASGKPRIATMASRPRVDEDVIEGWAMQTGMDPITILGVLPELTDSLCGKRLVRDCARAALQASDREDVCGMDVYSEPVVLANGGQKGNPPLAALMYLEQRADSGDGQAQNELSKIRLAAQTKSGRIIAAPLLNEASKRLAAGRSLKAKQDKPGIFSGFMRLLTG